MISPHISGECEHTIKAAALLTWERAMRLRGYSS
jgi:hypothetical protein